jgi:hypothetical protein
MRAALAGRTRVAFALVGVALLVLAGAPAAAGACAAPPGFAPRERLASAAVVVLYRTEPATIELGRHFAVEAVVCDGRPGVAPPGLRVDARMPEHRHGMNYRPRVSAAGAGWYRAEGLLFHMPGRWQLLFDVERDGRTERLTADVVLE